MSGTRPPLPRRWTSTSAAGNEARLRATVARLGDGDTSVLTGDVTLTRDLGSIPGVNITVDGAGHFGSETERAS
jgi:hypothetical protein